MPKPDSRIAKNRPGLEVGQSIVAGGGSVLCAYPRPLAGSALEYGGSRSYSPNINPSGKSIKVKGIEVPSNGHGVGVSYSNVVFNYA